MIYLKKKIKLNIKYVSKIINRGMKHKKNSCFSMNLPIKTGTHPVGKLKPLSLKQIQNHGGKGIMPCTREQSESLLWETSHHGETVRAGLPVCLDSKKRFDRGMFKIANINDNIERILFEKTKPHLEQGSWFSKVKGPDSLIAEVVEIIDTKNEAISPSPMLAQMYWQSRALFVSRMKDPVHYKDLNTKQKELLFSLQSEIIKDKKMGFNAWWQSAPEDNTPYAKNYLLSNNICTPQERQQVFTAWIAQNRLIYSHGPRFEALVEVACKVIKNFQYNYQTAYTNVHVFPIECSEDFNIPEAYSCCCIKPLSIKEELPIIYDVNSVDFLDGKVSHDINSFLDTLCSVFNP